MSLEEPKRQVHLFSKEVFSIISYVFCRNRGLSLILLMLFLCILNLAFSVEMQCRLGARVPCLISTIAHNLYWLSVAIRTYMVCMIFC